MFECGAFGFDDVADPHVSSCFLGNNILQTGTQNQPI